MKLILCLVLSLFCGISFSQNDVKKNKKSKNANSTGWVYNDPENGGFEKIKFQEQEVPDWMVFIEGGTFELRKIPESIQKTAEDTLSLDFSKFRKKAGSSVSVSSFYLSDHEVTNKEYRDFVNWVKIRYAMDILADNYPEKRLKNGQYNETIPIDWSDPLLQFTTDFLTFGYTQDVKQLDTTLNKYVKVKGIIFDVPVYPDTTCWQRDYKTLLTTSGENMASYFSDEKYNDYPVVGVSIDQAKAYCVWLSDRYNESILLREKILKNKSYYFTVQEFLNDTNNLKYLSDGILAPNFRLLTECEWEHAACHQNLNEEQKSEKFFPWESSNYKNKKGKFLANFGKITDQNGLEVKKMDEDGYLFTSPVKSFDKNQHNLYDMTGNVAEWVLDNVYFTTFYSDKEYLNYQNVPHEMAFRNAYYRLKENYHLRIDTTKQEGKDLINEFIVEKIAEQQLNNLYPSAHVVKGGSWADAPVYMIPGMSSFYDGELSSSRIGFRVGMDRIGSPINNRKRRKK